MKGRLRLRLPLGYLAPKRAFVIVGAINKNRPSDAQLGLELYGVMKKVPPFHKLPWFKNRDFVRDHLIAFEGDGRIDLDKIREWWKEHGEENTDIPISRVHLPFHYSIPSGLYNYFIHSIFKEKGHGKDRAIASAVAWVTMTSMNSFARDLAEATDARINSHVNIIEEVGKRGTIDKVLGTQRSITDVENDLDYIRSDPEQFEAERDPQRVFDAIEKYELGKVIYGADHAFRAGKDPIEIFEKHKEGFNTHLGTVHLSGSRGDHGLVTPNDHKFWRFMEYLRDNVSDDVSYCLDLDPFEMDGFTEAEQIDYIDDLSKELAKY